MTNIRLIFKDGLIYRFDIFQTFVVIFSIGLDRDFWKYTPQWILTENCIYEINKKYYCYDCESKSYQFYIALMENLSTKITNHSNLGYHIIYHYLKDELDLPEWLKDILIMGSLKE